MKTILIFRSIGIILVLLLGLAGCGHDRPEPRKQVVNKYIYPACPRIKTLNRIKVAGPDGKPIHKIKLPIKDSQDPDYYLVGKAELKQASINSQLKSKLIRKQAKYLTFYEKQNQKVRNLCRKRNHAK